jgi:hypothetical protein
LRREAFSRRRRIIMAIEKNRVLIRCYGGYFIDKLDYCLLEKITKKLPNNWAT